MLSFWLHLGRQHIDENIGLLLSVILQKVCQKKRKNILHGKDSGEILGATDCLIPFGSPVKSWILAVSVSLLWRNSISVSSSSEEEGGGGGEEAEEEAF